VNDTIIVFDRIRENRGKLGGITENIVNDSINQTLSRTVLTSFTTMLVILILYVLGGSGIHGFSFVMLIGILTGTYSSIAVASPLLVYLNRTRAGARA
jgi:SecD/SecF fusion protein